MRTDPSNPPGNALPQSTTDQSLIKAIEESGYPLQGIVTGKLLNLGFRAAEEWGYIDRDTNENRTLDVHAWYDLPQNEAQGICPHLSLLIECKRSVHPLVFFKKVADFGVPDFPVIARCPTIEIRDARSSLLRVSLSHLLGSEEFSFVREPPLCSAFSRAELSGEKVRLSGEEPYKNIVLPLVKALDYVQDLYKEPRSGSGPLHPTILFAICVAHSAMVLVESPHQTMHPVLTPWTRVARLEAKSNPARSSSHQHYIIDFVHVDYFDTYVKDKLLPFAAEFFQRASTVADIIRKGGTVDDVNTWSWGLRINPLP